MALACVRAGTEPLAKPLPDGSAVRESQSWGRRSVFAYLLNNPGEERKREQERPSLSIFSEFTQRKKDFAGHCLGIRLLYLWMRGENSREGSGPVLDPLLENLDLSTIADEGARECIARLLNLVETLVAEGHRLRAENQRLRDEVSRLKGEQGKPNISPLGRPKPALGIAPRKNGVSRKIGTKAARRNRFTSTGNRSWKSTPRLCPRMRSSKGTKA